MEKLEICTEFIQLCQETDQKLRTSVEIFGETNYNTGNGSEINTDFSYPMKNLKKQAILKNWSNALKQKCLQKFEIHSNKANEKVKEKCQCSICGKLMASR